MALLLNVELVSRVPVHRWCLVATRVLATVIICGIAAWVSYWHMTGVATRYGETGASPYLLPVSVDGLMVASISLVELAGRIRDAETDPTRPTPTTVAADAPRLVIVPEPAVIVPTLVDVEQVDDGQPVPVTNEMLHRARTLVAAHRRSTGRDITRDELRAQLRV